MQEFLSRMMGRRMDIYCGGGASLRGELVKLEGGVLHVKDEEQMCYVAVEKIIMVWEVREEEQRPGFISSPAGFKSKSRK
ncbi:MAG TPA: MM0924 family protein [Pyrinomonadaceae bacterium]